MSGLPFDVDDIPLGFRPRLKLFLSADIIGSTAYKQPFDIDRVDPKDHAKWSRIINGFYARMRESLTDHWHQAAVLLKGREELLGPHPRFWKTVGDEVIFWKELTDPLQIWLTLACWMKTVASIREFFEDHQGQSDNLLDVKCTAWIAGFPVRNKPVLDVPDEDDPAAALNSALAAFYDDERGAPPVDFIGPGMDIGFRLSAFSSSRKMSVSLDVAYLMACSHADMQAEEVPAKPTFPRSIGSPDLPFVDRLAIYHSGSEALKGVLGGILYPKFWINMTKCDSLDEANERMVHGAKRTSVDWPLLKDFCSKFYQDRRRFLSVPFIFPKTAPKDLPVQYRALLLASVPQAAS